jgi:hypothetical protein
LRGRSLDLRRSLTWSGAAVVVTAVPALRRAGFGLVAGLAGFDRTARVVRLAGRIVMIAKVAGSVIALAGREVRLHPVKGTESP